MRGKLLKQSVVLSRVLFEEIQFFQKILALSRSRGCLGGPQDSMEFHSFLLNHFFVILEPIRGSTEEGEFNA